VAGGRAVPDRISPWRFTNTGCRDQHATPPPPPPHTPGPWHRPFGAPHHLGNARHRALSSDRHLAWFPQETADTHCVAKPKPKSGWPAECSPPQCIAVSARLSCRKMIWCGRRCRAGSGGGHRRSRRREIAENARKQSNPKHAATQPINTPIELSGAHQQHFFLLQLQHKSSGRPTVRFSLRYVYLDRQPASSER